ncbi:hypothetical protein Tco_0378645 [Tanacetum coccineum]
MADKQQDDQHQQQQQNMLDTLLVPIDEQVKIRLSNYRIALEKSHLDVIYKVYFWHTVHYDLTAKAYLFTIDDQNFEVNADLISEALQITPKVFDRPFVTLLHKMKSFRKATAYDRPRLPMLQIYREWSQQELLPFSRFTKLIIKHILSKNNNISKRPHSYHHVIKIDQVLKNLKFSNKGAKDPVFGMPIPMVMLNDEIKASTDYADYLAKSKGVKPKGHGKGLVTKKGVEVVVEKIAFVRVPKKKRTKNVTEQYVQLEGVEDDADSEETEEEDEIPLKLKGVERMSETAKFLLQLKKAKKVSKRDFILQQQPKGSSEGSGVTPAVLDGLNQKGPNVGSGVTLAVSDEPEDSSSTSSSDSNDEIEDISSDDDDKAAEENVDDVQDKD